MSKALPLIAAVVLGGAALVPVYYATQNPTTEFGAKADKNAATKQNNKDNFVFEWIFRSNLVKVTIIKFFMK